MGRRYFVPKLISVGPMEGFPRVQDLLHYWDFDICNPLTAAQHC